MYSMAGLWEDLVQIPITQQNLTWIVQKVNCFPVYFSRGCIELKLAMSFHGGGDSDLSKDAY